MMCFGARNTKLVIRRAGQIRGPGPLLSSEDRAACPTPAPCEPLREEALLQAYHLPFGESEMGLSNQAEQLPATRAAE